MLGFDVSERTISRWMYRAPRNPEPAKRWLAFLHNHREAIAAMDFFTVPTLTLNLLYCFFIISHNRRKSYTSMSRSTRPAVGLFSSYERHSLISPLPDSSSSITTRSMGWRSLQRFAP